MNTGIPVNIKARSFYYRERASFMYSPEPYALSCFRVELPWLLFIDLLVITPLYFMVGFNPDPAVFFFYMFVVWLVSVVFTSIGQAVAASLATADVAQAVVGLVIPILFLMGGLFISAPQLPRGWQWANWADPIKYVIDALVPAQFYCQGDTTVCPSVQVYDASSGVITLTTKSDYIQSYYGLAYANRWRDVGILFLFAAFFQVLHMVCVRYISHNKR